MVERPRPYGIGQAEVVVLREDTVGRAERAKQHEAPTRRIDQEATVVLDRQAAAPGLQIGAEDLMAKEGIGAGIVGHGDRHRAGPEMELGRIQRQRRLQQL